VNGLAAPNLVASSQEVNRRYRDDILAIVFLHQPSLDLPDRWSHRATERNTTSVIDIEPDHFPYLRDRPSGGLQCVAARQSNRAHNTYESSQS